MKNTSLFIIALFTAMSAMAQIPSTINFQGNLTEPGTTTPIADGDYTIDFSIYDDATAGIEGWLETQTVTVINGIFNVKLGAVNPLDPYLFDRPVWLEITVGGETLAPRIELASTPYSMNSANTESYETPYTSVPDVGFSYIAGDTSTQNYPFDSTIDLAIDDNDTGFDVLTDGNLSFYTNGVERMTMDLTGRISTGQSTGVGVGTKLELNYDDIGSGFGGMWITNTGTAAQPYYGYNNGASMSYTYLDGADLNKWKLWHDGQVRMTVTTGGNVGIGTTTPPERLSVSGNIAASDTVKADVFAYNTTKIKYYGVPGLAFKINADLHNPTSAETSFPYLTGYNFVYVSGGTTGTSLRFLTAPVNLPHGAIVREVKSYVYDNDATYEVYTYLYGVELATGNYIISDQIGSTSAASTTPQVQTLSSLNYEIDNSANTYWLYVEIRNVGSNHRVYGVTIAYEEPGF